MPPPKRNPAPASDLVALERGPRLILDFAYPKTTVSGLALPGIAAVEVWLKSGPAPTSGEPKPVDPREFGAEAKRVTTLKGADLSSAIHGDHVRVDFPLERLLPPEKTAASSAPTPAPTSAKATLATAAPEGEKPATKAAESAAPKSIAPPRLALWLAVRTVSTRGDISPFSNQGTIVPAPAPKSPKNLAVKPEASGISLSWSDDAKNIRGFRVYRRLSSEQSYGRPLALLDADHKQYLDKSAEFGKRYTYTVVAVSASSLLVESALGGEAEVAYEDRFPPPVPQRLVALPTHEEVRLLWEASHAPDLLGYIVERREAGSASWRRLTSKPQGATQYDDRAIEPGMSYEYRVLAVDSSGNESAASTPASVTVPGS